MTTKEEMMESLDLVMFEGVKYGRETVIKFLRYIFLEIGNPELFLDFDNPKKLGDSLISRLFYHFLKDCEYIVSTIEVRNVPGSYSTQPPDQYINFRLWNGVKDINLKFEANLCSPFSNKLDFRKSILFSNTNTKINFQDSRTSITQLNNNEVVVYLELFKKKRIEKYSDVIESITDSNIVPISEKLFNELIVLLRL